MKKIITILFLLLLLSGCTSNKENKSSTIVSSLSYYTDSVDFSVILKVIKSFVYNPELLYMNINDTMSKKMIRFSITLNLIF